MTLSFEPTRLITLAGVAVIALPLQIFGADAYLGNSSAAANASSLPSVDPDEDLPSPCGPVGTRFNLEGEAGTPPAPFPVPQQEESLDALAGAGFASADGPELSVPRNYGRFAIHLFQSANET
jgi:hypothetical protein